MNNTLYDIADTIHSLSAKLGVSTEDVLYTLGPLMESKEFKRVEKIIEKDE